ncbi:hypothetical protein L3V82_05900 [Thiotrichales bacterium 19S3-7]|nr:hypothetical protein [Thiotrichales bacterium 19S3-7]MCF6801628.1 hypothetical protein [Thiotrichales bacterium 19S3-11]
MGIEELSWDECKHLIEAVNQPFYQLLAEYPGIETYTFKKYSYAYGQIVGDEHFFYRPDGSKILENIPFSIFLNNNFEFFMNVGEFNLTHRILKAGDLVYIASFLSKKFYEYAFPNISICAGTRNPMMIGNFGNTAKYHEVSNYLDHDIMKYVTGMDDFYLLREICKGYNSKWRAEFLAFPIELHKKIQNKQDIYSLKLLDYIYNYFLDEESFAVSYEYYNITLSYIRRFYSNMKNSSYINEIVKDIYKMVCEYKASYVLANDSKSIPLDDLHFIFNEVYKSDTAPFIMIPAMFSLLEDKKYYFSIPIHTVIYKPEKVINLTEFAIKVNKLFEIYRDTISKLNFSDDTRFVQLAKFLTLRVITDRVSSASKNNQVTLLKELTELDINFHKQITNFQKQGFNVLMPQRSKFFSGAFLLDYKK